jgi:hypothetical protein
VKWSEVVKEAKGIRQKEQTGADVLSLLASIMLLTQFTQNSCPQLAFSEQSRSQQIKHSGFSTFSSQDTSKTRDIFFA